MATATIGINGQTAGMTANQFSTSPPYNRLQHVIRMPDPFMLNTARLSNNQANMIGLAPGLALANSAGTHVFAQVYGPGPPVEVKKKRSCNSFMAYRAFYSSIFAKYQQKKASSYLTITWHQDPFKAKWTILARAYSAIRDRVGKPRAPLDEFLKIVCPEIGIIGTADYLRMMLWELEIDVDGVVKLRQVSVPDMSTFDHRITHTTMTEKDVVHYCAERGYISQATAIAAAGQPQAAQQGLLATAQVITTTPPAANSPFLMTTTNPTATASNILGFDVDAMLGEEQQSGAVNLQMLASDSYEWTGSMADLYSADEGTFNFESLGNNYGTPLFDIGDISNPLSFERMFGEVTQDGFFQPSIPGIGDNLPLGH